jgi:hypothetical protein
VSATRRVAGLLALTALSAACAAGPPTSGTWTALPLPALDERGLPALPERSPRNANYTIEARLDPATHKIEGTLVLDWHNLTQRTVSDFPFHLYWNAFRNNLSTSARGERRRGEPATRNAADRERRPGYMHVQALTLLSEDDTAPASDLLPTLRYIQPDDGNVDDRTVAQVTTPRPIGPGGRARFRIQWSARLPYGDAGRAGWVHDYHFVVQWFPKLGVLQESGWNSHQFHANTEFFSDFGVYDVRLDVPQGFVVGATGQLQEPVRDNPDGTRTHHYAQADVHDFAWTASRRFLERTARFEDPGYPPVAMRLLLQPEHAHLAERYLEATRIALRSYGTWSAPYPYPQITVVDPAWNSGSGGMEYPTLFTGGAAVFSPPELQSPEGVTIHEAGHQFWYGLVATNEFEEAWLDEGFNSYHDAQAVFWALGPKAWSARYFGYKVGARKRGGWPFVATGVWLDRRGDSLSDLREHGQTDVLARKGWEYRTADAYTLNAYDKPALVLQTLEGLLGQETMTRVLRTYARRYRFAHPRTADFIATVGEVTGQDWRWFFDETFFSSELCDYAVQVKQQPVRVAQGFVDGPDGAPSPAPTPRPEPAPGHDVEVSVLRLGGVRLPVEVLVQFEDGSTRRETWDGRERWTRFRYAGSPQVRRAVVDPEGKLALDANPANNAWVQEHGAARRAATKWSARFLFWLQNLLEMHAVLG